MKLPEYKGLVSVDTIVFANIAAERVRVVQRTGGRRWDDDEHEEPFDVPLPSLGVSLLHAEIFAR